MWSRASTFSSLGFYSIILRSSRFKQHCCMRSGTSHGSVLHVILLILVIIPSPLILKNNWWNHELTDVQAGFRKGRGTRDQIANICWITEKTREFQKNIYFCFMTMPKPLTVWITINYGKFWKRWEYQSTWPASWETYMQVRKQQLQLDMEQQTASK